MTESYAGHETPAERTTLESAWTEFARTEGTADSTATRIARIIANRRARRATTKGTDQ